MGMFLILDTALVNMITTVKDNGQAYTSGLNPHALSTPGSAVHSSHCQTCSLIWL